MKNRNQNDTLVFAHRLTPVALSGDTLLLMSEDGAVTFKGQIYVDLARSLAQGLTWKKLEGCLGKEYSRLEILARLQEFVEGGLTARLEAKPREEVAFWEGVGVPASSDPMAVVNLCGPRAAPIIEALKSNGLKIRTKAPRLLAITDDYLRPELDAIARKGHEWLLAKPIGHTIWIGPVFGQESTCWWCLAHWLRTNRWQQAAIYGWGSESFPPQPAVATLPGTSSLAAGLISTVAAVWTACGDYPELRNQIITLDTRNLQTTTHAVHPRPGCSHCRKEQSRSVGTMSLREWVSPYIGIISHVDITTEPSLGFFQARAAQAQPLPKPGSRDLLEPSWALGPGKTFQEAEGACLGEAIERYSIVYQGNERSKKGTLAEVEGISPESLLHFSERQYETRVSWNASHSELHWVPERFDPARAIRWSEARHVLTGARKYLPSGYCYLRYPFRNEPEFASADSNGCAAGRTLEEAILRGLLELIERDALTIWWYNRLPRPAVDLQSLDEPFLLSVREEFAAAGRDLYVLDLTHDLATPVYVAVAPLWNGSELYFASAAHPNSKTAATRAIAELTQTLHWGARLRLHDDLQRWLSTATLGDQSYFKPMGVSAPSGGQRIRTVREEIQTCVERIEAAGMETYYVDLTRPEIGIPVARVVAPGLRYFWARLGPGRLYELPCRLGWLSEPNKEEDLNPIPCMV